GNWDTEKGFDGLNVLASDDGGSTYQQVPLVSMGPPEGPGLASAQIDGNSGGYRLLTFDLSGLSGATIQLRLQFTSDAGVEKKGFAVDDLTVTGSRTGGVVANLSAQGNNVVVEPAQGWIR